MPLLKIWLAKPETARRVCQRIGTTLDYAHAKGWRADTLDTRSIIRGLPRQKDKPQHNAALPWPGVPEFIVALRDASVSPSVRLGFQFLVLTATRSGEMRLARWSEVNLEEGTWTIPAARMKAGRAHVVPLSDQARAVLDEAAGFRRDDDDPDALIFEGAKRDHPMSDMALTAFLRREHKAGRLSQKTTAHGFRSSFRDWVADRTSFPREVAEAALAHVLKDKTEAAYARTTHLDKRRDLMRIWGAFCDGGASATVIALKA